jgi:hypothetical protein
MQGPVGLSGVSISGVPLIPDERGCVEVDHKIAAELLPHGFVPFSEKPAEVDEVTTVSVDADSDGKAEVKVKVSGKPKPRK